MDPMGDWMDKTWIPIRGPKKSLRFDQGCYEYFIKQIHEIKRPGEMPKQLVSLVGSQMSNS